MTADPESGKWRLLADRAPFTVGRSDNPDYDPGPLWTIYDRDGYAVICDFITVDEDLAAGLCLVLNEAAGNPAGGERPPSRKGETR